MTEINPNIDILESEDVAYLIDCVRRCYGDSYPNPLMYEADRLKEVINSKLMHSIIAKHSDGHIIGHCALTFNGQHNTSPEAGKMIVDPDYRGHHIAETMAKKRIEVAKDLNLVGFWTECVTNHPYSQHEMITFGAKETGLLLGVAPPTIVMQGLDNFEDTRMSLLTMYLPLQETRQTIYIPQIHLEFVASLTDTLHLNREVVISEKVGVGKTEFVIEDNSSVQTANILIHHIGEDFMPAMNQALESLTSSQPASIYLDLPVNQEAAAVAHLQLESMGFFWGCWIPNYSIQGDILRLQKINQGINSDEIHCARTEGENIKQYVLSEWERVNPSHPGI